MPPIQLSTGAHGRDRLRLPYQRQVNAYVEATPGGPEKFVNTARPGLTQTLSLSPGPILRGYQDPGLFNGDAFHVSGGNLYRNSTLLGQVAYSQNPRMVAANNQLAIVRGARSTSTMEPRSGFSSHSMTASAPFLLLRRGGPL